MNVVGETTSALVGFRRTKQVEVSPGVQAVTDAGNSRCGGLCSWALNWSTTGHG
jgi:hypothetical protein